MKQTMPMMNEMVAQSTNTKDSTKFEFSIEKFMQSLNFDSASAVELLFLDQNTNDQQNKRPRK
jgi:hypothetical protein